MQCNLKTIENSLFAGCKNLKSLVIPNSVEEIEQNVFSGCEGVLDKVKVQCKDGVVKAIVK